MKMLSTAVFVLSAFAASAQFMTQGTHLINGSLGFETYKEKTEYAGTTYDEFTYTAFYFSPNYGYFVIDNLVVGAAINFGTSTEKDEDDEKFTQTSITFGPVVRYYIQESGAFGQGYVGFGSNKTKSSANTNEYTESIFEWRLGVGYSVKLTESVLLDPIISYGSAKYKDKDNDVEYISSGHIMFQVGLTAFFAR